MQYSESCNFQTTKLTIFAGTDLALVPRLIVQHDRVDFQRVVAFFVAADHRVAIEAAEVPVPTQPEVVLGPLQLADLGLHPAGQRHLGANDGRLVLRLHGKPLDAGVDHIGSGTDRDQQKQPEVADHLVKCRRHHWCRSLVHFVS